MHPHNAQRNLGALATMHVGRRLAYITQGWSHEAAPSNTACPCYSPCDEEQWQKIRHAAFFHTVARKPAREKTGMAQAIAVSWLSLVPAQAHVAILYQSTSPVIKAIVTQTTCLVVGGKWNNKSSRMRLPPLVLSGGA
jgi:hypothetical protein